MNSGVETGGMLAVSPAMVGTFTFTPQLTQSRGVFLQVFLISSDSAIGFDAMRIGLRSFGISSRGGILKF